MEEKVSDEIKKWKWMKTDMKKEIIEEE